MWALDEFRVGVACREVYSGFSRSHRTGKKLLGKGAKFVWGPKEKEAFNDLKTRLAEIPRLSYFNIKYRTRLIADASPVALGAVLLKFTERSEPQISQPEFV